MRYTDPDTGIEVECTPQEYAELRAIIKPKPAIEAPRTVPPVPGVISEREHILNQMTYIQRKTYLIIESSGSISTSGLAKELGVDNKTAASRVQVLKRIGVEFEDWYGMYRLKERGD